MVFLPAVPFLVVTNLMQEHIKKNLKILRSSPTLWVKLDTEHWQTVMDYSFICSVICVGEEWAPSHRQRAWIYRKAMVLTSDKASDTVFIHAWLVVTPVAIPVRMTLQDFKTTTVQ